MVHFAKNEVGVQAICEFCPKMQLPHDVHCTTMNASSPAVLAILLLLYPSQLIAKSKNKLLLSLFNLQHPIFTVSMHAVATCKIRCCGVASKRMR